MVQPRKADRVDSLEEGADAMDGPGPGDGDACASCHGGVHGREDEILREMMAGDLMALCEQEMAVRAGDEPVEGHDELGEGMEAADARRQAIEWWREACARKGDVPRRRPKMTPRGTELPTASPNAFPRRPTLAG